jgi:ABC-type Mn2+/Zn2+ transport system permease subunit
MIDLWHWLSAPFGYGFMQRAFAEMAIVGLVGGLLGCWIVLYGLSYSAESLAHGLFPGLVIAVLLGLPLIAGGALGLGLAALAIGLSSGLPGLDRDTTIGVVITSGFGLGVVLALSPSAPPGLQDLLFGDVLAISAGDLARTTALAAVVVVSLAALHGRLLAVGFDRAGARAIGIRARPVETALLALIAAAVLIGIEALGSLLVVAALVAPAAAARLHFRTVPATMAGAVTIGVAAGAAGLYVSYYADLAAGASIALCHVAGYAVALALRPGGTGGRFRAVSRRARRSRSPAAPTGS